MSTLTLENTRFGITDQGDGVPVVFLHAGVCDRRMWAGQVAAVSDAGYRGVAYDRRGFGETVCDPADPFAHAEDLEAVLDALGIRGAVLVGCSQGGRVAIDFAFAHPDRVAGLVLVSSAVSGAGWSEDYPDAVRNLVMAIEAADEVGDIEMMNKVEAHAWLDGPAEASGRVGGGLRELFLDMNGIALNHPQLTGEVEPEPVFDRMEELEHPTLIVSGALDWLQVRDRLDELEARMPNAFGVMIDGTAHLPSMERPDLFDPLLLGFLDQLFGPTDDELSDGD